MVELEHDVVARYAEKRQLPVAEARMLDGLVFRGEFPFDTIAEVHGFYETIRMIVAPTEIGPPERRPPQYTTAHE